RLLGPAQPDLLRDVRTAVLDGIGKSPIRVGTVAEALGLSAKTLERRLRQRRTTFSSLVDGVRSELSEHLLRDTDMSLGQIAYLAGYSTAAAWQRAFKRRSRMTPLQFRQRRR